MKPTRPTFTALALACCLASAAPATSGAEPLSAAVQATAAAPANQSQTFTLSNGMTLIVQPDHRAPTAVHMVWVRVGSVDEVDGTTGVAHVLEHMMFKGTPSVPEGEFSRRVAALGGRDNAFTSHEVTAYHQQVPADRLEDVMALEADRFARNQWPDDAFQREMGVIKEERRQRIEESPQARLFEAFGASAFLAHPGRRPVIGWMGDLDAMSADDARTFFHRWYVPANAAVVVVGDVDPQRVRELAEKHYGAIAAQAVPVRKAKSEPEQNGVRRVELRGRTQQPMLVLGYKAPRLVQPAATDAAAQDALALTLLAGVLNGHEAARLNRSLVQGRTVVAKGRQPVAAQRLADDVDVAYGPSPSSAQLFMLVASPTQGVAPERLEAALKAEIQRVARDGVDERELQRVKNLWSASDVYKRDSMFAQARELGSHWAQGWPLDAPGTLLQRLQAITPEQVRSVAERWFKDTQLTVGLLLPEVAP